jgi:SagB-type dehydrogenase family enzyme
MRHFLRIILAVFIMAGFCLFTRQIEAMEKEISLPVPQLKGKISLEEVISERRSTRRYRSEELSMAQISQLLWSAQGITDKQRGFRAAPSAGALYPIEAYILTKDGLFRYLPDGHKLEQVFQNDVRKELAQAARGQDFIAQAPVDIVIAVVYERVSSRYGQRGRRYTDIEVGHAAQNIHLQAVGLGLDSVPVGAFDERKVKKLLRLPDKEEPLYIIPVGYAK